jgi:hypothetical protein
MAKDPSVWSIIGDIKRNGYFYIKSRQLKKSIEAATQDITFEWDKEDQLYIARYEPISGR